MSAETGTPARILVVDDDAAIRHMLTAYLTGQSMEVDEASGRQEMLQHLDARAPDLVILDLRLDREDGLDLLRELRLRSDMPVIIMTGHRRDEIDRVVGLELGADDYITKPFGLRELLARIRAVLRRNQAGRGSVPQPDTAARGYRFGAWTLDQRRRTLTNPAGEPVPLTKGEFALLVAFLEALGRPLDRSIDVQVLRLRRKLEADPSIPHAIQTERGIGYRFGLAVEAF